MLAAITVVSNAAEWQEPPWCDQGWRPHPDSPAGNPWKYKDDPNIWVESWQDPDWWPGMEEGIPYYIGACPPVKQEVELKAPEPPVGRPTVKRTSRIVE